MYNFILEEAELWKIMDRIGLGGTWIALYSNV
jgi:hypothetical protein